MSQFQLTPHSLQVSLDSAPPHRSTCVSWSTRCTTQTSASVTLLPSMMAAVRLNTWRTSSAPRWPTMSCWCLLWEWWGCGQMRGAGRANSGSSSPLSMNVSESQCLFFRLQINANVGNYSHKKFNNKIIRGGFEIIPVPEVGRFDHRTPTTWWSSIRHFLWFLLFCG